MNVTIGSAESLAEPFLVGFPLPLHPESVGLCTVTPKRAAWMEIHDRPIGHIGAEAHAVKQLLQSVKLPLKSGCPF